MGAETRYWAGEFENEHVYHLAGSRERIVKGARDPGGLWENFRRNDLCPGFSECRETMNAAWPRIRREFEVLLWCVCVAVFLAGCDQKPAAPYEGYIAGRFVQVAAPVAGRLTSLGVSRGGRVDSGSVLFALESQPEVDAVEAAAGRTAAAEAALADLQTGARQEEITALGHVSKALQAARLYATIELQRSQRLYETKVVSEEDLNRNQSAELFFQELVRAVDSYTSLVGLPARDARIAEAAAMARSAGAELRQATWQLEQKVQRAPVAGFVFDTLFLPGEWVPAGAPVVSLLPPGEIVARFYLPEEALPAFLPGRQVVVASGGKSVRGTVTYVSPEAAYAPPVIYSRDNAARLVFLVEIGFAAGDTMGLHPGQPAQVAPAEL